VRAAQSSVTHTISPYTFQQMYVEKKKRKTIVSLQYGGTSPRYAVPVDLDEVHWLFRPTYFAMICLLVELKSLSQKGGNGRNRWYQRLCNVVNSPCIDDKSVHLLQGASSFLPLRMRCMWVVYMTFNEAFLLNETYLMQMVMMHHHC
jgi:hypothetical protein